MGLFSSGPSRSVRQAASRAQAENDLLRSSMNVDFSTSRAADDAAEYTGFLTLGNLGAPGTYEDPYESGMTSYWGTPTVSTAGQARGGTSSGLLDYRSATASPTADWRSAPIFDQSAAEVIQLGYALNENQASAAAAVYRDQGAANAKKYVKEQLASAGVTDVSDAAIDQYIQNPMSGGDYKLKYWNQIGGARRILGQYTPPILDPYKASEAIGNTRTGRMVSYATAQADEFLRGTGPLKALWDEQVLGPIYATAATTTREALVQIDRDMARGGTARRTAIGTSQKLVAQEAINRDRQTAVWQAKQAMQEFAISNARNQALFNELWVSNYGMINRNYRNAVMEMSKFYSSVIVPTSSELIAENFALTQQVDQKDSTGVLGAVMMGVGLLATMFAGPLGGAIGGLAGALGAGGSVALGTGTAGAIAAGATTAFGSLGTAMAGSGLSNLTGTNVSMGRYNPPSRSRSSTPPASPGVDTGTGQPLMIDDQLHISKFPPRQYG